MITLQDQPRKVGAGKQRGPDFARNADVLLAQFIEYNLADDDKEPLPTMELYRKADEKLSNLKQDISIHLSDDPRMYCSGIPGQVSSGITLLT